MPRLPRLLPRIGSLAGVITAIAAALVLILVLSAVRLLPQLRNPFAQTTTVRSEPVILKSITNLSRYEIQAAAQQSPLLAEAQKNTQGMLDGMLTSLGFQHVTVTFGTSSAG